MRASAFREDLGRRTADQLTQLLELRPDVAAATPIDLDQLAQLLSSRNSVHMALQNLTRAQLDVLERAAVLGALDVDPHSNDDDALHAMALVHPVGSNQSGENSLVHPAHISPEQKGNPDDPGWALSPGVADALGRYPAGLGRPVRDLLALLPGHSQSNVEPALDVGLLQNLPGRTAEVLANFRTHPVGSLKDAHRTPVDDDPLQQPIDWLLARNLLVPVDPRHVEMPREVGLALQGGDPWSSRSTRPTPPEGRAVNARIRDNAAQAAVLELVRDLKRLRAELRLQPLAVLHAGGVGVRELRRLAAALELDQDRVGRLLGYAWAAGLIAVQERTGHWISAPVPFESLYVADAHGIVLVAWWNSRVVPSAVGTHGADGSVVAALTRAVETPDAPAIRRAVALAMSHADQVPPKPEWLIPTATWLRPRLAAAVSRYGPGVMTELAEMGLTGAGAAVPALSDLLSQGAQAANAVMAQHVPAAVHTVTVQNDHTAVAAGPLSPAAATDLALVADPEGRGAADTFRFSVTSLQRGLEHGYDAAALTRLLETRLDGPIPASLQQLMDEAARTHGALRIESAQQVVTGRPDLVAALASSPELARYQVRRPSPEVMIVSARLASGPAPFKRDPLRSALVAAAQRAGVQPTLGPGAPRTPSNDLTGDLADLLILFPPAAPAAQELDPEHVHTVAQRLARCAKEDSLG